MRPARVALVGPEIEENLSLRYLVATLTRANHEAAIVRFDAPENLPRAIAEILALSPDVVGLSLAFQWRAHDFFALALALREAGFRGHITAGGHFATFQAKEVLEDFPEIDTICRQEAEETIVALATAVVAGTRLDAIRGLAVRDASGGVAFTADAALPDLATLPWPDRSGPPATSYGHAMAPILSSRGCYANCTFCCIAAWHEQSSPGKRYRLRDPDDVAAEMKHLADTRGIEIFVFQDDNFFLPTRAKSLERLHALADAIERQGLTRFATVVRARPNDIDRDVLRVLVERLGCVRAYVGIETDSEQGLKTLRRWVRPSQNHLAIARLRERDAHACYNVLLFDPDTTVESLRQNLVFLRSAAEFPSNFARVELYAGTPLLARMRSEGRLRGDYVSWDYTLASAAVERTFAITMRCFAERNFGDHSVATRITGTRFDVEVVRRFHPEVFEREWVEAAKEICRDLTESTVSALERIIELVERGGTTAEEDALVAALTAELSAFDDAIHLRAHGLEETLARAVEGGPSLGEGMTPLQRARSLASESIHA